MHPVGKNIQHTEKYEKYCQICYGTKSNMYLNTSLYQIFTYLINIYI